MLPESKTFFKTENIELQRLYDTALCKSRNNIQYFGKYKVLVEGGGYKKIWLETQPMGGEMYAGYDLECALNNCLLFMLTQRENGRIPGSIQCENGKLIPQFNKFQGFCFPSHALNVYYLTGKDPEYLDMLENCLKKYDKYLWNNRDSNGDGILESFCITDTGEDNAVRYGDAPFWWENENPPKGYNTVPMSSMDIMSFSYACRSTLSKIAKIKNNDEEDIWHRKATDVKEKIQKELWDETAGACFDRDSHGNSIRILSQNNIRCMYWGSFSQHMADVFVRKHLLNPDEFWTEMPLPSTAVNDPAFRNEPSNNWSGQCEGLTFQRAISACENYGYDKLVKLIGNRLFNAVTKNGYIMVQQYSPFTGEASRVGMNSHHVLLPGENEPIQDSYGPTILSVLGYMCHMYGVHVWMDEVWFSLGTGAEYTWGRTLGDSTFTIESDGKCARILVNGNLRYCLPCGKRIITDMQGNMLRTIDI